MMMKKLTKSEAESIAHDVHAARPEWAVAGILTSLKAVVDRDPAWTRAAALAAAHNPAIRTPRVIALDGDHWTTTRPTPTSNAGPAGKCPTHDLQRPCRSCRADALVSGAEPPSPAARYQLPHLRPHGVPMPQHVRALIRRED